MAYGDFWVRRFGLVIVACITFGLGWGLRSLVPGQYQRYQRFQIVNGSVFDSQTGQVCYAGQYQYVKLPDGSFGKFSADADDVAIRQLINKDYPHALDSAPSVPTADLPTCAYLYKRF